MKLRDVVGFLLLLVAVAGIFGGVASVSRDVPIGWAGVAVGLALNVAAFRLLRPPVEARPQRAKRASKATEQAPAEAEPSTDTARPYRRSDTIDPASEGLERGPPSQEAPRGVAAFVALFARGPRPRRGSSAPLSVDGQRSS